REYGSESTGVPQCFNPVRSDRVCVTCVFEKNWHGFQHRCDPVLFGSFHESHRSYVSERSRSNHFVMKLMSPLRSTRATRIFERSLMCTLRRISSSRSCIET